MLHIVPGDCALETLARAGLDGELLAWRDILHEGPVPGRLALEELSRVRAQFIAACGWGELDEVQAQFEERDFKLAGSNAEDEVVLWFESDLFDQLQLLQLLDWFADDTHRPARLMIVDLDREPNTGAFEGLGGNPPERIHELFESRAAVTGAQLALGRRGWAAFRSAEPEAFAALLAADVAPLPYLQDAVLRLLQELPSARNGLSRTEEAALQLAQEQPRSPAALFSAVSRQELRPWLGDWAFGRMLDRLMGQPAPLLESEDGARVALPEGSAPPAWIRVRPTREGRVVLSGAADAVRLKGVDRWMGGTRLQRGDKVWRWDAERNVVVARE
jgi:hypothetical protein